MSESKTLIILETHAANLAGAKTFEEYRDCHVAYVDMLIEREKARLAGEAAETKFMWREKVSEDSVVVETAEEPK